MLTTTHTWRVRSWKASRVTRHDGPSVADCVHGRG